MQSRIKLFTFLTTGSFRLGDKNTAKAIYLGSNTLNEDDGELIETDLGRSVPKFGSHHDGSDNLLR